MALGNNAEKQLAAYVERIASIEGERQGLAEDVRDVLKEAKGAGFDPKAIRAIVRRRLESEEAREKREAHEETLEQYLGALGDLVDTPLGRAAVQRRQQEA